VRRIAATLAVLLFSVLAAPAQAAITTSTITSPADDFAQLITGVGPTFTPATLTVSGTSNGTTGDLIQVRAYYGTAPLQHDEVGADVGVAANGTWSVSVPNNQDTGARPYGGATLYAVPPAAPPTLPDSANFHPTRMTSDTQATTVYSGVPTDFRFIHTGTQGFFDAYGIADCSVCDTAIYDSATRSRGNYLWYGAGININESGKYGAPRANLQIDGRNALFPSGLQNTNLAGNSGIEPVSVTFTNGAEPSVTDVEPALRCTNATPFPPTNNTDCGVLVDTGVRDSMTVQSANGGRRQLVTHRIASTNGAAHDVDAHLTAYANIPSAGNEQHQMQWISDAFVQATAGQTFSGPPAAGTVLYRANKNVPDGSAEFPIGALTISPAPQFIQFRNDTPPREFIMPYRVTVSPGHDLVVKQQFDTEPSLALAQADGAAARAAANTTPNVTGETNIPPALAAVSGLAFSSTTFAAESSGPSARTVRKRAPRGTRVSYTLNQAATVRFTVTRRAKGRKVKRGKKTVCVKPTRKNRKRKRCTRVVTLKGSFSRNGIAGKNSFHFTGRLRGRKLKPGRYRLVATPTAGGNKGKRTSKGFRIVR
jgi:hypothetical protein